MTKSEETKKYIIQIAAPIFNKYGYAATSMSQLTNATKLTKGAIYGNFKNKEELAVKAFRYNIKLLMQGIKDQLSEVHTSLQKLQTIVHFYKDYYEYSKKLGGCPILNVGVDANNKNDLLSENVKIIINRFHDDIAEIIQEGINNNELKETLHAKEWAIKIDSLIQGAIFMTYTMNDDKYLVLAMNQLQDIIDNQLKK
jgi:AcrR family transcriptional regulator